MNYKKEERYMVDGFHNPVLTVVLVNEAGKVEFYSLEDNNYYDRATDELFFSTLEKALQHRESIIPKDLDKYKEYLEYIYENSSDEHLEELLPEGLYKNYKRGVGTSLVFGYKQLEKIKKAIQGLIEIGPYTVKREEITRICFLKDDRVEVKLTHGETLISKDKVEKMILECLFGDNYSGTVIASR
jgi:hypothetical protein